jgi:hypothetical protein
MTRFMFTAAAAAAAVCGAASVGAAQDGGGGGWRYRNFVDPCWPERYNFVARQETLAPFAAQVLNGHVLDQTIWTWYFDPGTDKLNSAGLEKLDSLARRRPGPDAKIYLQTARDVGYNAAASDAAGAARNDMDYKRALAVQKYLVAQRFGPPVPYEILVHDPADPGMYAEFAATAFRGQRLGYRGGIIGGGGIGAQSTGGGQANTGSGTAAPSGPGTAPNR